MRELIQYTENQSNWATAISNPCFEVWLHYPLGDPRQLNCRRSAEFKSSLHNAAGSGYKVEKFAPRIEEAVSSSKTADPSPEEDYPHQLATTKVYRLGEALLRLLGMGWK